MPPPALCYLLPPVGKSIYSYFSTHFKFKGCGEQLFGSNEQQFCVDQSKTTVGIHGMVGFILEGICQCQRAISLWHHSSLARWLTCITKYM